MRRHWDETERKKAAGIYSAFRKFTGEREKEGTWRDKQSKVCQSCLKYVSSVRRNALIKK